jgi:hypothetical protein
MRPLAIVVAAWALSGICRTQQAPSPAAPERDATALLRQRLRDTAAGSASFAVRWQSPSGPGAAQSRPAAPAEPETAGGSFGLDWLLVEQPGKQLQWLQVGRHTVSRRVGDPWQLVGQKRASAPGTDAPLLLRALAANVAAVAAPSIAERDGVVIEQFSVCLEPAQADALAAAGALFDLFTMQGLSGVLLRSGRADAKDVPVPVVDVCVDVEVATRQVRRVHVRAMCEAEDVG